MGWVHGMPELEAWLWRCLAKQPLAGPCVLPQGPSRDMMLNGFFKNRVLAWSKEEGGAAPLLVQARTIVLHGHADRLLALAGVGTIKVWCCNCWHGASHT